MLKTSATHFFDFLGYRLQLLFEDELQKQIQALVIPVFRDTNLKEFEMSHFIRLQENGHAKPIYIGVRCLYKFTNDRLTKSFKKYVRYNDEIDMDFYMAIEEYENKVDPNPVLFN